MGVGRHREVRNDFFFQAEDGIRDIGVTGVQTCALPISSRGPPPGRGGATTAVCSSADAGDDWGRGPWARSSCRSEERRVGKSVDLGGRRIIKKNISNTISYSLSLP